MLLIPGFMAGDLAMLEMHCWLRRVGYRSELSRVPWNNDCPNLIEDALSQIQIELREQRMPQQRDPGAIDMVSSDAEEEIVMQGGHVSLVAGGNAVFRLWPPLDGWIGDRAT